MRRRKLQGRFFWEFGASPCFDTRVSGTGKSTFLERAPSARNRPRKRSDRVLWAGDTASQWRKSRLWPATARTNGGSSTPRLSGHVRMTLRAGFGSETRRNGRFCRPAIFPHWRGTDIRHRQKAAQGGRRFSGVVLGDQGLGRRQTRQRRARETAKAAARSKRGATSAARYGAPRNAHALSSWPRPKGPTGTLSSEHT